MRRASGLRCRCCEFPLPTDAARCPNCGAEQQASLFLTSPDAPAAVTVAMPRRRRPVVVVALGIAALVVAFVLLHPSGSSPPAAAPAPVSSLTPPRPTTTLASIPAQRLG